MNQITCTATGMVHLGNNQWESLDRIQRAVEVAQTMQANREGREGQMQKSMHANCNSCPQQHTCNHRHDSHFDDAVNEEALPLPTLNFAKVEHKPQQQLQRINFNKNRDEDDGEHLPLPSLNFSRR